VVNKVLTIVFVFLLTCSCRDTKHLTWSEFNLWLADHQEIFVKEQVIDGVKIGVQYLPPQLSAYRELTQMDENRNQQLFDSLKQLYSCGIHLQLIIEADPAKKNLLYYKTSDQVDYKLRIETLSFRADEFVSLEFNGKEEFPVLFQYEGYNELANRITIHLVFSPQDYGCDFKNLASEKITVLFHDPYWETGSNRFAFYPKQFEKIPALIL